MTLTCQLAAAEICREKWPGSLFLSAAEEAPHETVERHIRGILGAFRATISRDVYEGISNT